VTSTSGCCASSESLNQTGSREVAGCPRLGHGVKIAIEVGAVVDSPARRNKHAADERQRVAEEGFATIPKCSR
jgi:DNA polymerase-3 subunit gamma/tau